MLMTRTKVAALLLVPPTKRIDIIVFDASCHSPAWRVGRLAMAFDALSSTGSDLFSTSDVTRTSSRVTSKKESVTVTSQDKRPAFSFLRRLLYEHHPRQRLRHLVCLHYLSCRIVAYHHSPRAHDLDAAAAYQQSELQIS